MCVCVCLLSQHNEYMYKISSNINRYYYFTRARHIRSQLLYYTNYVRKYSQGIKGQHIIDLFNEIHYGCHSTLSFTSFGFLFLYLNVCVCVCVTHCFDYNTIQYIFHYAENVLCGRSLYSVTLCSVQTRSLLFTR